MRQEREHPKCTKRSMFSLSMMDLENRNIIITGHKPPVVGADSGIPRDSFPTPRYCLRCHPPALTPRLGVRRLASFLSPAIPPEFSVRTCIAADIAPSSSSRWAQVTSSSLRIRTRFAQRPTVKRAAAAPGPRPNASTALVVRSVNGRAMDRGSP